MVNHRHHSSRTVDRPSAPVPSNLGSNSSKDDISQALDAVLVEQALSRRANLFFGAANAPRSRPFLEHEGPRSITHIELLNTIRDLHLLLLQQKAQLDDLRCQVARLHGGQGKLVQLVQESIMALRTIPPFFG